MSLTDPGRPHEAAEPPAAARGVVLVVAAAYAALGLYPVANLLSDGRSIPWWPSAVQEWLLTTPAILVVALLLAWICGARLDEWGARAEALVQKPAPRPFGAVAAATVFALTAAFALYCFAGAPFSQDEMAQRFHGRILLAGRLFAQSETHPEFFSATGIVDAGGRWYSMYPVGGPAVLAVGMALRAVWLVNPLLTALTVWNLYRFAAAAWNESTARASVALFALSPFVLVMGASQMNHVATLALATLALAALPTWVAGDRRAAGAAAQIGLAVGAMAAVRPLDAALVGAAIGVFQLTMLRHALRRWRSLVLQVLIGLLPVATVLYANARTTGHPLEFGYEVLYGPGVELGFHDDPYGVPFTPRRALEQTSASLLRLSRNLFQWPVPGLVPIVVALLALRRPSRWDMLLVGLMVAVVAGYGLYWFDGFFAGPRFLYTAVPAFIVLAARAPGLVARWTSGGRRRAVLLVVPLCVIYAWVVPTGVSSVQMNAYLYHAARTKLKTDIESEVARAGLTDALVFVHEPWRARLQARLLASGLAPGDAERILDSSDACQVQSAVDAEDARPAVDAAGRRTRILAATRPAGPVGPLAAPNVDEALRFAQPVSLTATCVRELAADSAGSTPFAPFLALADFERDGSLGGAVVFARDFGLRNELLRARFPGRAWFRYRPRRGLGDTTAAIVPY